MQPFASPVAKEAPANDEPRKVFDFSDKAKNKIMWVKGVGGKQILALDV